MAVTCSLPLAADDRQDPMDILIAVDKSLSMEEEIEAVREYVSTAIIDDLLIPGDLLIVVAFFGDTEVLVSGLVSDNDGRARMREKVESTRADGRWTDIGGALDELQRQLELHGRPDVPKHMLLITDGKQEAPPESPYWSADGSFNHEFLANTRTIQKEGWKVQVLGIGTAADARQIADRLSGIYTEVPEGATVESLTESTRDFLGSLTIVDPPEVSPIGRGGRGTMALTVRSSGYGEPKTVLIDGIRLTTGGEVRESVLVSGRSIEVPASGTIEVRLPITVAPELPAGHYRGTFEFVFGGAEQLVPTVVEHDFRVNTVLQNNLAFVVPGAALVVLGLLLLVLLQARRAAPARVSFRVAVDGVPLPKGKDVFHLTAGTDLYLQEDTDVISLDPGKTGQSIGRLSVQGVARGASSGVGEKPAPALTLEILDPRRFAHAEEVPQSLLGAEVVVKAESSRRLHVRFEDAHRNV
jgi:hypothetical protein